MTKNSHSPAAHAHSHDKKIRNSSGTRTASKKENKKYDINWKKA
jgi:hypothetical protein